MAPLLQVQGSFSNTRKLLDTAMDNNAPISLVTCSPGSYKITAIFSDQYLFFSNHAGELHVNILERRRTAKDGQSTDRKNRKRYRQPENEKTNRETDINDDPPS